MKIVSVAACTVECPHLYYTGRIRECHKVAGHVIVLRLRDNRGRKWIESKSRLMQRMWLLLAVDVKISGMERFEGKRYQGSNRVVKSPSNWLLKLLEVVTEITRKYLRKIYVETLKLKRSYWQPFPYVIQLFCGAGFLVAIGLLIGVSVPDALVAREEFTIWDALATMVKPLVSASCYCYRFVLLDCW